MLKKNILNNAILSCKNHRDLDKETIKKFTPGYTLMKNAGKVVFKVIKEKFKKKKKNKNFMRPR